MATEQAHVKNQIFGALRRLTIARLRALDRRDWSTAQAAAQQRETYRHTLAAVRAAERDAA